ncbi:MAG TPA: MBL fold metallo-hydrolase [Acidimicrobiales bacterium]
MYEIDFLPVGDEGQSGDAIAARFTRPDTGGYGYLVVDAGFQDDGEALVEHVQTYYKTNSIDVAIVTHPDGDHIGGMGTVIRELAVESLLIHRLGAHGGETLPAAAAVDDLIKLARSRGTAVTEPFAGLSAFGGALKVLGPDLDWYRQLVADQVAEEPRRSTARAGLLEAVHAAASRFIAALPVEVPFGDAGGTNPRNNTSVISMLEVAGHRMFFTGDAGVPSLDRAWDWVEASGLDATSPQFVQIPHAGSRHNASSAWLDRLLGEPTLSEARTAYVSVASKSTKHPSPRVVNAYIRRGCRVHETRGRTICHRGDGAPIRDAWRAISPLEPMDESDEE